jgi:hypothetical protein
MQHMKVKASVHGFRSTFRDWAGNETDFAREHIEECLAHQIGNSVEQAYRRQTALKKRQVIMEAWASYCENSSCSFLELPLRLKQLNCSTAQPSKEQEMATKGKVTKPAAEKATPVETSAKKAPPAKKVAAKVAAKSNDTGPAVKRTAGTFAADSKIKVLVEANPKREGSESYKRFALYKNNMTVEEALTKGVTRPDLNWDVAHEFIAVIG